MGERMFSTKSSTAARMGDMNAVGQVGGWTGPPGDALACSCSEWSQHFASITAEVAFNAGWADEGDVEELRDQLEMLGLVQPRHPPLAARRRWGGQP